MKQRTLIQEGQHYEKIYGLPGFRSGWEVRSIADQVASLPHAVLVNLNDPRDARTISCLTIANRHVGRARALARWIKRIRPRVRVCAVSLRDVQLDGVELLVNATSVGMRAPDRGLIEARQLRPGLLVYDLIYHRETALLRAARRRGCVAAGGLSMLLYQGAESLRLWLHRPPPLGAMRRALRDAVKT